MLENIFVWGGAAKHEVVFFFTAAFADEAAYEIGEQAIVDTPDRTRVIWRLPGVANPPRHPEGVG